MTRFRKHFVKWLVPIFWALLGLFFCSFVHGHSFLGLISFAIGGITVCYYLLRLLQSKHLTLAKVLRRILSGILIIGILVSCCTLVVIWRASRGDPQADCAYIVVLGAKVNGTSPSLSLAERIHAAGDYLKAHPQTVAVLSGGQGPDEGISEALCMFQQLTAMGIAPERLWLEDKSTSTWENLQFSLAIIEEKTGIRPDTLGVVSSEYHLFRARLFAKSCNVEAVGIPGKTSWFSLRLNYFLREVAGVWHYWILGGQYHD